MEKPHAGQSEIEVADMVDMFMLLLLPGSGDELKKVLSQAATLLISASLARRKPRPTLNNEIASSMLVFSGTISTGYYDRLCTGFYPH